MIAPVNPIARAAAVMHVSFERKDVDAMARFLSDFGFVALAPMKDGKQYFRGYGRAPYCVELIASDRDAFVGFTLAARSREDLETLAKFEKQNVEPVGEPGGGERLRLYDPDGNRVDFLWGEKPVHLLPARDALVDVNRPG